MKTCRIQIRTTCKPRDAPHLSGESSEGGKKLKNKSTSTWTGPLIFRKSNKGPQMSHTRKHTHMRHTCGPAFSLMNARSLLVKYNCITDKYSWAMATKWLLTICRFFFFFFPLGTPTHVHLSDETIEDAKLVDGCQNGHRLLFTNLIILFSSR